MMQRRERIPNEIVENYEDSICFMVETNHCLMEAIELRIVWFMPMGYEVSGDTLNVYAQHILSKLIDTTKERIGTYKEK